MSKHSAQISARRCAWAIASLMMMAPMAFAAPVVQGGPPSLSEQLPTMEYPYRAIAPAAKLLPGGMVWVSQGPGPSLDGQVENVAPDAIPDNEDQVVGSIHVVLPDPGDPDTLYIGSTNGGVWKTTDATSERPHWVPLLDDQISTSIGALVFDPLDDTNSTLVAGVGRFSSFGRSGGMRVGLYRTTDAGANWTAIQSSLAGKNISGIAARGDIIVISVNTADQFFTNNVGIFRSIDGGANFDQISVDDGTITGLPAGVAYDLVSDPNDMAVLYTSIAFADLSGGISGVYRSDDTGETWTRVSTTEMEGLFVDDTSNVEMAVGQSSEVYVAIVNAGHPEGLFRSDDGSADSFVALDLPSTNENGVDLGLNPEEEEEGGDTPEEVAGGQGNIHFSIVADPFNNNVLYVGGDRQPHANEGTGGPPAFPNSIGANQYSGRLFRGDATEPTGSQFVHLTHSNQLPDPSTTGGTANSSAPHADSREMAFDAAGNLIETDDGGIYRRTSPEDNTGDWVSLNGDLRVAETHDIAYDPLSNIIFSGNQDTGVTEQLSPGSTTWESVSTGDGGDVAYSPDSTDEKQSIRYSSFQNLNQFRGIVYDSGGNLVDLFLPSLTSTDEDMVPNFLTPIAVNSVNPDRLLFGGNNFTYESPDRGETISPVGPGITAFAQNTLIYGGMTDGSANEEVIWYARGAAIYNRFTAGDVSITTTAFPGGTITDIAVDPSDATIAYVCDASDRVYTTPDGGENWDQITGDLAGFGLRTLAFIPGPSPLIAVGGNNGVYSMSTVDPLVWTPLGSGLPNARVWDMTYNLEDDILVIGTLGRGAWSLSGFQPAPTPTISPSPSPLPTQSPSPTASPSPSQSPSPTATVITASPTDSPTDSPTATPTASATDTPTETATPTVAVPTMSASPTTATPTVATASPTTAVPTTSIPTPTATVAPTATPSVTSTPIGLTPTATDTVSTPTMTPTPSPTIRPGTTFEFENDNTDGWQTGAAVGVYDVPVFSVEDGALRLLSTTTNSFGFWTSPPLSGGILPPSEVVRANYDVYSDQLDPANSITVRLRVNTATFDEGVVQVAESAGDGSFSPSKATRRYSVLFRQPRTTGDYTLSFDTLSFNPLDAANTYVALDRAEVDRYRLPATPELLVSQSFLNSETRGWTPRTASPAFQAPRFAATAVGLSVGGFIGSVTNDIYGSWSSPEGAVLARAQADGVYEARYIFETSATADQRSAIPAMRFRVNSANLKFSQYVIVESVDDNVDIPLVGENRTVSVFFVAPREIDGNELLFSFDYIFSRATDNDASISGRLQTMELYRYR